ncbi:cytochrome b/b6 domain-containing protein [Citromicrobium bathyomarinum]
MQRRALRHGTMTIAVPTRWPVLVAMLHWSTAALALATAGYAIYLLSPPDWSQPYIDRYMAGIGLHKAGGLIVLTLALCWVALRMVTPRPPLAVHGGMRRFVLGVHAVLMALVILLPLSGYAMDGFAGHGLALPGNLAVPPLLPRSDAAATFLSYPHKWAGYALLGLVALHIAGALRHAVDTEKGDVLLAMMPWASARR